ncbi:LPXTG cell wall anchor domain-containing protein [Streptomyces sp. NBC_00443]
MPTIAPIAYKGLDSMPTWFVVVVAVLATFGIVLAYRRRR